MQTPAKSKGFTLIELLIVVAIIAILAAIAVPNFLEAQTRAKVARTVADMRSLATAIEAYAADYNHYPQRPSYGNPGWDDNDAWLVPLTTPIAFMTSLPDFPWKPWSYPWMPNLILHYYEYNERVSWTLGYDTYGGTQWWVFDPGNNHRWSLSATGPDGELNVDSWDDIPGSCYILYDPSNGTVSRGDIIRLGP